MVLITPGGNVGWYARIPTGTSSRIKATLVKKEQEGHFKVGASWIWKGAFSAALWHADCVLTQNDGIWVEKLEISIQKKLLEDSCQKDERKQRAAEDLESTFCTHRLTNNGKVWGNYSNCRGICNYYKSSQPTKAMLSTFHEVHWKLWEQKWQHVWAHFLQAASAHCVVLWRGEAL